MVMTVNPRIEFAWSSLQLIRKVAACHSGLGDQVEAGHSRVRDDGVRSE